MPPLCPSLSPAFQALTHCGFWEQRLGGITISSSSTRSCLRHFRDTLCSLASCRVSLRTVVLRQITTSTLQVKGEASGWLEPHEGRWPESQAVGGGGHTIQNSRCPSGECLSCKAHCFFFSEGAKSCNLTVGVMKGRQQHED